MGSEERRERNGGRQEEKVKGQRKGWRELGGVVK